MLKGVDISHHNKNMKDLRDLLNYDFVIMKASEGKGYKDTFIDNYMDILKDPIYTHSPLIGFYHYARPELNTPEDEAANFLYVINRYTREYKCMVALDVEGMALTISDLDDWCLKWCKLIFDYLGYKPLIYCSAAETKRFKKCTKWGAGLWIAKWGNKPTKSDIKPWDIWAIWQYTNNDICSAVRVDGDYFNGTRQQFLKYCEVVTDEETENNSATDSAAA